MPNDLSPASPSGPLVAVLAYDGLCTFEFGVAVEVFGLARPEFGADWYRFRVAAEHVGPMQSAGGLTFFGDLGLEGLEDADLIMIPGWRGIDAPVPDAICDCLRRAVARGARILTICSGVVVPAAADVLEVEDQEDEGEMTSRCV
jgi:AraC family transcriptional activator FtrA